MHRLDLSVGGWLAVGFGTPCAVLAVLVAVAITLLGRIEAAERRQTERIGPRVEAATLLESETLRLTIAARAYAVTHEPHYLETYRAARDRGAAAQRTLAALATDSDGADVDAKLRPLLATFEKAAEDLVRAADRGDAALDEPRVRLGARRDALLEWLGAYLELQREKLAIQSAAILALRRRAEWTLVGALMAVLILLGATALLVTRAVRRPVRDLVAAAREVGAGDYGPAVGLAPPAGAPPARNELLELTRAFGSMAVELEEREVRIAAQNEELHTQNEELASRQERLHYQREQLEAHKEELQRQNDELQGQAEQLRVHEARLREAMARLAEEDRRKSDFLAVLSHELRNPLAPIVNGLHLLTRADPAGPQARRAREIIERQVAHLVRLVDDLLDLTRISRGKVQLDRKQVDLVALVRHAAEDYGSTVTSRGVSLELALPAPEVFVVNADPARLTQVVGNLLSNAAKFTPAGGRVNLAVERIAGARAAIRIRDTGIGIPPEVIPDLFQPFTQAETSLARTRGGLGLGLALVKGLVELHGGTVRAVSGGEDQGAEFTVELPLDGSETAPAAAAAARRPAPGRRILLIEDNVDAAESLADVLRYDGHEVEVAHDGGVGLQKAREWRPDVVLCDLGLPVADGYEVARQLRREPALAGIFLVALTGYALPEDVRRAREAGFDEHLTKPAGADDVARVLQRARIGGSV